MLETRQRILEAARDLFHRHGYHATGVGAILKAADVNSGSMYHYFKDKEDLLRAVLEWYINALRPAVIEPAERVASDPIERVFALLANYRLGLEVSGCAIGCPIGNLALELGETRPEISRLIDRNMRNWSEAIRGWLDEAGDRLPADLDRAELADFILTVMEGGIVQARAAGSLTPFDRSVSQLRSYVDRLVREAKERPQPVAASRGAAPDPRNG